MDNLMIQIKTPNPYLEIGEDEEYTKKPLACSSPLVVYIDGAPYRYHPGYEPAIKPSMYKIMEHI